MGGRIRLLTILFSLSASLAVFGNQYAFKVTFSDKNGTPFSLTAPGAFLTERSLLRRTNQGIAIDSTDLPVNPAYLDSVLARCGGTLFEASKWQNLCVVMMDSDTVNMQYVRTLPFVTGVSLVGSYSPDLYNKPSKRKAVPFPNAQRTTSDEAYYNDTWGQTSMVNGNYLNDLGYQGSGKLIAILDAGFIDLYDDPGFDSLFLSHRIVDQHNFSYHSDTVDMQDDHGTLVLSTMAAYAPYTFVGAAPKAYYALYVTEIEPSEQPLELINLLCGAERADSIGADIITCSLGYNTFDNPAYNFNFSTDFDGKTTVAAQAANAATQKGILFVASAGNEGGDSWNMVLTPGDADSALTIGSVMPTGAIAGSSGFGPNAAGQIKPDVVAQGEPAAVVQGGIYAAGDGTSFSTPQIAGWAACLWQEYPSATPSALRMAIRQCASMYAAPQAQYGYGIPNFMCSAHQLDLTFPTGANTADLVTIRPNPTNGEVQVFVESTQAGEAEFRITDIAGRVLYTLTSKINVGKNPPVYIGTGSLPSGMYLLETDTPSGFQKTKLVKL